MSLSPNFDRLRAQTHRRLWMRVAANRSVAIAAVVGLVTLALLVVSRVIAPIDAGWIVVCALLIGVATLAIWMRRAPPQPGESVRLLDLHCAADDRLTTLRDIAGRDGNRFAPLLADKAEQFAGRVACRDVRLHTFWWDRPALLLLVVMLAIAHAVVLAFPPVMPSADREREAAAAAAKREAAALEATIARARELGHDDVADALTDLQRQILGTADPDEMQRAMARLQREARVLRERQARQAELREWADRAEELSQSDTATLEDATSLAERARRLADRLRERDADSAASLREAADALDGSAGAGDEIDVEALAQALARLREQMRNFADDETFVQAMNVKVEALGDRVDTFASTDGDGARTVNAAGNAASRNNAGGDWGNGSVTSRHDANDADTNTAGSNTANGGSGATIRVEFQAGTQRGGVANHPSQLAGTATHGTGALAVRFAEAMAAERSADPDGDE